MTGWTDVTFMVQVYRGQDKPIRRVTKVTKLAYYPFKVDKPYNPESQRQRRNLVPDKTPVSRSVSVWGQ